MPTPPDPQQPPPGPVLEPIRVVRLRHFDALAELMRDFRPDPATSGPATPDPATPDPVRSGPVTSGPAGYEALAEARTQQLPPVPTAGPATAAPVSRPGRRRAVVAVAVAAAALVGFGGALLLPGRQQAAATARPTPSASSPIPATPAPPAAAPAPGASSAPTAPTAATDPDGPGVLRQGDTGPDVTDLQQRLLRIPDVYRGGSTGGTYDVTLTEAVARFQLWYGISGDEKGVYGDDTRRALESRTGFGDDA
ncbi:peptidoglycan-binding domain-containing protein [Streptomyces cinerochromogenes]|uniref:peptidoglycan-binding domain-containing protein n=1 Tax=Streptomyces cinerochromogenes TaxID=66422 RepID=UPI0033B1A4D6